MKKGHRRVHHLFWYLALPILILFLFLLISRPTEIDTQVVEKPAKSPIAIIP